MTISRKTTAIVDVAGPPAEAPLLSRPLSCRVSGRRPIIRLPSAGLSVSVPWLPGTLPITVWPVLYGSLPASHSWGLPGRGGVRVGVVVQVVVGFAAPLAGAEAAPPSLFGPFRRLEGERPTQLRRPLVSLKRAGEVAEGQRQVVAGRLRRGDEADRRIEHFVGVDQQVEAVEDAGRFLEGEQRVGGRRELGVEDRRCA